MRDLVNRRRCTAGLVLLFIGASDRLPQTSWAQAPSISGEVYDSLQGRPLQGATVQLASANDSARGRTWAATTDSAGRYRIADVPAGSYVAGFFHPVLDSLGFASEPRPLAVAGALRADFAIPSSRTIVSAVCGMAAAGDSTGLLVGHVRATAGGAPLATAQVSVAWAELVEGALLVRPAERARTAETTPEGWFAICGVPGETALLALAAHGADTSGYVRLTMPPGGVRHAPFTVGGAVRAPSASRAATETEAASALGRVDVWRGGARLTGTVRNEAGRPLPDAEVLVWGTGLGARAGSRGAFTLDSLPGGTQTVEVRAVGYTPVQRVVQLVPGDPATVELQLSERAVTLPSVAVTASATGVIRMTRFYERMRDAEKGINRGFFITPEELDRRKPDLITRVFQGIPGLSVQFPPGRDGRRDKVVYGPLRTGPGGDRCAMTIYLDGLRVFPTLGGGAGTRVDDSLDTLVIPTDVAAIEIYPYPVDAPPQYQSLNGRCGVILLWTK